MLTLLALFFLVIFFFTLNIDIVNYKYEKLIFIIITISLIFYAGFRDGDRVNDYYDYIKNFNNPNSFFEPTFVFFSFLVKTLLGGSAYTLFFIYAAFGVGLKTKALTQLTPLFFLSLLVYLSHYFILHELTQIRVGVASGFLLLCIKPIYDRNLKTFLLFATCAFLFHYSAIIIFFLWFINGKTANMKVLLLTLPISLIIYYSHFNLILAIPIPFFQKKIIIYKELQDLEEGGFNTINVFNYLFLIKCFVYYLFLYKFELLANSNRYAIILIKIYSLSIFILPAFAVMPVFAFRVNELLGIVEIVLLPFLFYIITPKIYAKMFVVLICLMIITMNIFYNKYILAFPIFILGYIFVMNSLRKLMNKTKHNTANDRFNRI